MKAHELKKRIMNGEPFEPDELESYRSKKPVVYSIETTNNCNMRCDFCPRTTLMTRPVETMPMWLFERIAEQIEPWPDNLWREWEKFVDKNYKVPSWAMSENHFFLYIIPKVITLHGFGEPLVDSHISERVRILSKNDIPTYFSSHWVNAVPNKVEMVLDAGLNYFKLSVDCAKAAERVLEVVKLRDKGRYETEIVACMIDRGNLMEFQEFVHKIAPARVYLYLKSQDQIWYKHNKPVRSIHWSEFCQYPWSSMAIDSSGKAIGCSSDYDSELVLGDTRTQTLWNIWNGEPAKRFRENHINVSQYRCFERCDRKMVGEYAR